MSSLTEVWIQKDVWNSQVKIYMRQRLPSELLEIHSLGVDGLAVCDVIKGCEGSSKPYLTIPGEQWDAIEKELFSDNQKKLEDDIQKLKGEVNAKNQHIENLNQIFEKTLNKVS